MKLMLSGDEIINFLEKDLKTYFFSIKYPMNESEDANSFFHNRIN
jgi:hypothetical protein